MRKIRNSSFGTEELALNVWPLVQPYGFWDVVGFRCSI